MTEQAKNSLAKRHFAEAAALFERAGRLRNSDPSLLFSAGEAYLHVRDYINASNCFRAAKAAPDYPLAATRYARCLKQQARYEEAREAFEEAGKTYTGDHKELILQVIENELAGCELALQPIVQQDSVLSQPQLTWLPPPVASEENEFAPLPFSDTLLYFSQIIANQTLFVRSTSKGGAWQTPKQALGLPAAAAKGFMSGSFSTDGQRFYFARCDQAPTASQGSSVQNCHCSLFALRRTVSGDWGEPETLRDYINLDGSNNIWPFVCQIGEEEWLFFASDRIGSLGGTDIYYCRRPLYSEEFDFSFPMNLGNKINTGADEVTPQYDVFSNTLWFSSMGHPSLGGLDVFSAIGLGSQWEMPQNAGLPINSPADDCYFALKRDGSGAYLVSNRLVPNQKTSTQHDDIFEIVFPQQD